MGGTAQSKLAFISSTLKKKSEELNKSKNAIDNAEVSFFSLFSDKTYCQRHVVRLNAVY